MKEIGYSVKERISIKDTALIVMVIIILLLVIRSFFTEDKVIKIEDSLSEEEINQISPENAQELLKEGVKTYTIAAQLLATHWKVIHKNKHVFPNASEEDIFAAFASIFMSESKGKKNLAGTSINYIKGYNGMGVKCGSSWESEAIYTSYWEVVKGKRVEYSNTDDKINAFRKYNSLEEAIDDWFKFISKPIYKKAHKAKSTEGILKYLVDSGYCTDKNAANNWIAICTDYPFREIYLSAKE